jgi:hypothetical protein
VAAAALSGCEAELVPAFTDSPRFELLVADAPGPVRALLLEPSGAPVVFGGPPGGPPLAARLGAEGLEPLPTPAASASPRAAARSGATVWVAGPGVLWDGPPDALGARPLPAPALPLRDVAAGPGGGLVVSVGAGTMLVIRAGALPRRAPLATTASSGLAAAWIEPDRTVWLAGQTGLLGAWTPRATELEASIATPPVRSLDGRAGRLYLAGGEERGYVAELAAGQARDLSVGTMPPLEVVRATSGALWVGGRRGFLARFDGARWSAWDLPVRGGVEALAVEPSGSVLAGGSLEAETGGWVARFWPSRVAADATRAEPSARGAGP